MEVSHNIIGKVDRSKLWVGNGGDSYYSLVHLQLELKNDKPTSPFKFNSIWVEEEDFQTFIKNEWRGGYDHRVMMIAWGLQTANSLQSQ
jgi:hypothetical protein